MMIKKKVIQRLKPFGRILNTEIDPEGAALALERDVEITQILRLLGKTSGGSFLLVGPSGCGKSVSLQEALRIHMADKEQRNSPWIVLETSSAVLMRGTDIVGQLEGKVVDLVNAARRRNGIIISIKDIYNVTTSGITRSTSSNIADFLIPYVESGQIHLVGECTEEQLQLGLERRPDFKKLFTLVRFRELSDEQTRRVLQRRAEQADATMMLDQGAARTAVAEDVIETIFEHAGLYLPGVTAPANVLTLLDRTLEEFAKRKDRLSPDAQAVVERKDVLNAINTMSGVPTELLDDAQKLSLGEVRAFFESRILGQKEAVEAVVDLITLIKAGLTNPGKPLGVYLFVGPTGVGKTELVKAMAEYIFASPERMIRFDMSEFKDYHAFEKLIGDPRAEETSHRRTGSLLGRVRQAPFSIVLLDEIEKAHANIFDLLLQVFDDGRLSDAKGTTTSFTQTIIVMTSNLGSQHGKRGSLGPVGFVAAESAQKDSIPDAVYDFFRPEFLNRIDKIVPFKSLGREHMGRLVQRELGKVLLRNGITRRKLSVDIDPKVIDVLIDKGFNPAFGARPLKRAIEQHALLPMARKLLKMPAGVRQGGLLRLKVVKDRIAASVDLDRETEQSGRIMEEGRAMSLNRGAMKAVDPLRLRGQMLELSRQMTDVSSIQLTLEKKRRQCLDETSRVDFWDEKDRARHTLATMYRTERLLEAVKQIQSEAVDLQELRQSAVSRLDKRQLRWLSDRFDNLQHKLDLLNYSIRFDKEPQRCDAFLSLTQLDDKTLDDVVGHLADMYTNWARRRGFQVRILHEALQEKRKTAQFVMLIEGVAIYGLLGSERGVHKFVYDKTSKEKRFSSYVRVDVYPLLDSSDTSLPERDLDIKIQKAQGKGLRCKHYRSDVTVTHTGTHHAIRGVSDLSASKAQEMLLELVRSRVHEGLWLKEKPGSEPAVVRVYGMRPQTYAKSPDSGISTRRLDALWKGRLEPFLPSLPRLGKE